MDKWNEGDLVWYEPSPGIRFGGTVLGPGTIPECYRVHLCGHYWQWKSNSKIEYRARIANAISGQALTRRAESIHLVDEVGG